MEPRGGDIAGYRERFGKDPLDFSASLNPLGMPEAVRAAARQAVDAAVPYPDPFCRDLTIALASRLRVCPDQVFFGNGAAEVIFRLVQARRPHTALLTAPSFAEYECALESVGCDIRFHAVRSDRDFILGDDILAAIIPGVDMLFLCQPNNPTGQCIEPERMRRIVDRCRQTGTMLIVDECFLPFVENGQSLSVVPLLTGNPGLVVVGSFTKLYAMAGLRLGFALCGDPAMVTAMRRVGPPWSVSNVAQAAGLAALAEDDYVRRSLAVLREEKHFLRDAMTRLGLRLIGGEANYLFFSSRREDVVESPLPLGIMVRGCGTFRGLGPRYYRIAVRLHAENVRLIEALRTLDGL
ncbi:MAG: aminotransferase class I/II-fold pyridoxal phosphate-dependent enzyme [Planctomycetaceae bacterium]|nr:aminotransferase class I/II-fold pyridoxal phosphate-dependent enzyme [Planctomycetaceae bacterium]